MSVGLWGNRHQTVRMVVASSELSSTRNKDTRARHTAPITCKAKGRGQHNYSATAHLTRVTAPTQDSGTPGRELKRQNSTACCSPPVLLCCQCRQAQSAGVGAAGDASLPTGGRQRCNTVQKWCERAMKWTLPCNLCSSCSLGDVTPRDVCAAPTLPHIRWQSPSSFMQPSADLTTIVVRQPAFSPGGGNSCKLQPHRLRPAPPDCACYSKHPSSPAGTTHYSETRGVFVRAGLCEQCG